MARSASGGLGRLDRRRGCRDHAGPAILIAPMIARLLQVGRGHSGVPVIGFSGRDPRAAWAPGAENVSQEDASFFPSRVFYPLHSRHRVAQRLFGAASSLPA